MLIVPRASCIRTGPNDQRLVSTGPLDIANQLCKISLAHTVGIVRVCNELVQSD